MNGNQEDLKTIEEEYSSRYDLLDPADPLFEEKVKTLKNEIVKKKIKVQTPRFLIYLGFILIIGILFKLLE